MGVGTALGGGGGIAFGGTGGAGGYLNANSISNGIFTQSKIDSANISVRLPSNGVNIDLAQTLDTMMKNYELLLKNYEYLYGYLQYKGMMDENDYKQFCEAQEVANKLKESK